MQKKIVFSPGIIALPGIGGAIGGLRNTMKISITIIPTRISEGFYVQGSVNYTRQDRKITRTPY